MCPYWAGKSAGSSTSCAFMYFQVWFLKGMLHNGYLHRSTLQKSFGSIGSKSNWLQFCPAVAPSGAVCHALIRLYQSMCLLLAWGPCWTDTWGERVPHHNVFGRTRFVWNCCFHGEPIKNDDEPQDYFGVSYLQRSPWLGIVFQSASALFSVYARLCSSRKDLHSPGSAYFVDVVNGPFEGDLFALVPSPSRGWDNPTTFNRSTFPSRYCGFEDSRTFRAVFLVAWPCP